MLLKTQYPNLAFIAQIKLLLSIDFAQFFHGGLSLSNPIVYTEIGRLATFRCTQGLLNVVISPRIYVYSETCL